MRPARLFLILPVLFLALPGYADDSMRAKITVAGDNVNAAFEQMTNARNKAGRLAKTEPVATNAVTAAKDYLQIAADIDSAIPILEEDSRRIANDNIDHS